MRSENGIPRPFQPSNLAQQVRDLERKVKLLEARRNFVSVERIVEGGTINENVGKQLTDTVQETIVIDRQNLAEAALTDVVVTGTIATKGKTAETPPRDISVQLTTVTRNPVGSDSVSNPAVVFVTDEVQPGQAPGIYSPDGKRLFLSTNSADGSGFSTLSIGQGTMDLTATDITLSSLLGGGSVTVGNNGFLGGTPASVNLLGSVKVNGNPLTAPGPWVDLPLLNGWKITNSNKMRPSYRINGDTIEFRGSISGGTNNVICQMPTGARALKEENKVVPQYNTGWVNGTVSVAPDGYIRLDTYASNVYSVNLDFSYSTSP